jgi:hypothetical protein
MAVWPSFTDGSYKLETVNAAGAVCQNLYPEPIEKGPLQGQNRLRGIPGMTPFGPTLVGGPIRALWSNETELFAIAGGQMWQVFDPSWEAVVGGAPVPPLFIGLIPNGTNPAIVQTNGFQLGIASAGQAFIDPGGGVGLLPIVDTTGAPVNLATLAVLDNYLIGNVANTKQIFLSNLAPDGGTWDPADTAIKEGYPDNIKRVWVDNEELWLFGDETTEVWIDTGGLFPFSRIPGAVFPIGTDSAWAVAGTNGYRFWPWRGQIYMAFGLQPQRISDFGVEEAIKTYSLFDQQNAEAFAWRDGGHIFYAISYPNAGRTWVFDMSTQMWHERLYYSNGQYGRYRGRVYAYAFGKHLVGDYATGQIYQLDPLQYYDAPPIANPTGQGVTLRRRRVAHYINDSLKNIRYNRLTLDMDTGVGISGPTGTLGVAPQVTMRFSLDRGKNWSYERRQSLGQIGQDSTRVFWTQLGASRLGVTAEIVVDDPVPVSINGALIDVGGSTMP